MALTLVIATSAVPVYGLLHGLRGGVEWTGRQSFSPGDLASNLSSIAQARDGAFFLRNLATTEPTVPVPNVVWWAIGIIARVVSISPLASYHCARIALIPVAVSVWYFAIATFVDERRVRVTALLLVAFGSGLGAIAQIFLVPFSTRLGWYEWATDLWVSESNPFASMMYSPHFVASWTLLVAALALFARALERSRMRDAAAAGAVQLLLYSFHPFYAPTVYVVAFAWVLLRVRRAGYASNGAKALAASLVLSSPAVIYHGCLAAFTVNGSYMPGANPLSTPSAPFVLLGLGGFVLLAPFGLFVARRRGGQTADRTEMLATWAAVTIASLYVPVTFQRRLMEGLEFPLAILAAYAVVDLADRISPAEPRRSLEMVLMVLALAVLFIPSSVYVVLRDIKGYEAYAPPFFFAADEAAALAWMRSSSPPDAIVLASPATGNDVLGWGERRVYIGHWVLTIDKQRKADEARAFFSKMSAAERREFLDAHGISLIYYGPRERSYGASIEADRTATPVFANATVTIYSIRR